MTCTHPACPEPTTVQCEYCGRARCPEHSGSYVHPDDESPSVSWCMDDATHEKQRRGHYSARPEGCVSPPPRRHDADCTCFRCVRAEDAGISPNYD